ncbi:MAG: hypothetical protein F9K29_22585 [Hyphomicrobiaceae bacterium]|nr:MAG: hypothetical protein F9K29_22585 [Hyphomicrobiaceae bacterium]
MHFTYAEDPGSEDLQQGDVLKRTPDLDAIVRQYHPYYGEKKDYTHFLVITQSCDLVRRNGKPCDCPYINLSVVRPLHAVLEREAAMYQRNPLLRRAGAVSKKNRGRIHSFVERLLNNNEKEYFYLHEEPQVGLYSSCAFLRLSIAIRSNEHYEVCHAARVATLSSEFRPKLGWLLGNIYSRVGTEDWESSALEKEISTILDGTLRWFDEEKIKATKLTEEEIDSLTPEEIATAVQSAEVVRRKDQVISAILTELQAGNFINPGDLDAVKHRLGQATTVAAFFKS